MRLRDESGQMTVELLVVLPVAIIVAVIAVNALMFFGDCAKFDQLTRNAVRTYASAPANGQGLSEAVALVEAELEAAMDAPNLSVSAWSESLSMGNVRVVARLEYAPTLFGLGLRSEVLGVSLPRLSHEASLVVDPYVPGIWF